MAQIETWLRCDLQQVVEVVPLKGHLFSADENANRFGIIVTNNGIPAPVSGTLVCYGIRHDGVTVRAQANISNTSRPSIVLTHDFYTVVGPIHLMFRLNVDNDETVLAACTTYVYRTTTDTLIDSGMALPTIENLVEKIDACERAANAANTAASNAESQVSAAQSAASAAQTAASNAASSASSASTQAANAASSASAAQSAASQAATSASASATNASASQTAAEAAQTAAQNAATSASNAATAASNAQTAAETAQSQVTTARTAASQAQALVSSAQQAAQQAASSAATANGQAATAIQTANSANETASAVTRAFSDALPNIVQGGEVRNDALYLLNGDGDVVAGPFTGFGGGGGGGGGGSSNVTFTCVSTDGNYAYTYSKEDTVYISMTWSSTEDEEPTGNGTLKLTVGGVQKFSKGVAQGVIRENVTGYLKDGDNTLVFVLTDAYGNRKTRSFSISILNLTITSNFDDSEFQYGPILFPYTPFGNLEKTMHFLVDGTQVATTTISSYGRQFTQNIPAQTHGSHVLTVYYTGTMNGSEVTSNVLHYDLICIESGVDDTIIASSFNTAAVDQYSTINIPYIVYSPLSQTSDVTISVDGVVVNTLTGIDRTKHVFSHRMDTAGTSTISIASGNAVKLFVLTVNAVTIGAVAETEGLKLHLTSYGRSNNEANPAVWSFTQNGTTIAATMTDFNFVNDGWVLDDDGITTLRVSGDARITIPYKPFETDKRSNGFTIEIDFATKDVRNYDSPILSCMNNGRGIILTSQRCELHSEASTINMQFKEEEHVRVAFVIQKMSGLRLIFCYINGIMSGVTQYDQNDNFAQVTPQNITIGSSDATMDIYTIRIYDTDLSMRQVEDNWIADTPDGELMLDRFGRNNVRDDNGDIVISKLPSDLPYMIINATALPQYKGDKKPCSGTYVDPVNSEKSFTFENCEINVQGTSSQYYYRKNYDMKFNGGFTNNNGVTEAKYKMRENSIAVKRFVMKADVASSEGANNVELVRLYNDICPYKTPSQLTNNKVRQGIDGFPIVIFWNNPDTNTTTFLGKYNFNNAKGTAEVYGFVEGDESWEMRNSGSNRVLYKDDYFSNVKDDTDEFGNPVASWQKDFECRYPSDEYYDYTQLQEFVSWVKSTDPDQATGDALAETADFGETEMREVNGVMTEVSITYTHDTAAYRKAKFKAQLANYAEVDSVIFYYLFTEVFLMMDSRAKNSFPSFMGSAIVQSTPEPE